MTAPQLRSTEQVARDRYTEQAGLARATAEAVNAVWALLDLTDIARSWAGLFRAPVAILTAAQRSAAAGADSYVQRVLDAQETTVSAEAMVVADSLAGVASDGRPLDTLLYQPAITTLTAIKQGAAPAQAKLLGSISLDMIVRTQVADAGRVATGIAVAARPRLGYVRMLNPPSCSRCVILAGRWYRWNRGFQRHPRCDCIHIPAAEDLAADLRTDPRPYFDSLSEPEQNRVFTQAGAQAIRDGADVGQVVNARRGMSSAASGRLTTAPVFGQQAFVTTESTTRRGHSPKRARLMPEQIYVDAGGDRDEALRLLRLHRYIL